MKKFAVILSGCGVFDGAEIHEAVMTLLSITQQGASYEIFAPDIEQHQVINHLTGEEMPEKRNVLIEAARIARGKIKPLSDFNAGDFDAMVLPGGFGVVKNLCDFIFKGLDCDVNPETEQALRAMHKAGKPIGALCVSPVLVTKVFGNVEVTIGQDKQTAESIERFGGKHVITTHGDVVIDETNNIFTTPCYMLDATIEQIYTGAYNVVKLMLERM